MVSWSRAGAAGKKQLKSGKQLLRKPKNEDAYKGSKLTLKRFLKNPSKQTYWKFKEANDRLWRINPTAAWSLLNLFKKELFNRALKEDSFK